MVLLTLLVLAQANAPSSDLPGWGGLLVVYGPLGLIAIAAAWFLKRTLDRQDKERAELVKDRDGWALAYRELERETRQSVVPLVPQMVNTQDKATEALESALQLMAGYSARLEAEARNR